MENIILRGDIYYADLDPTIGSEQNGYRPVLVIQNNVGNKHSPTVIIAAMTGRTKTKPKLPTHCYLEAVHGLGEPTIILLEQIRTVDKQRLEKYIDSLNEEEMQKVDHALAISLSLK